ncbi:NAD(P)-dependent glycerol-3-phosphate dehydrogenase [Leucobacter sp. OH2974_COT-288]|uniref:Glycerol-3-phosphate dehydrogenase [NAD(P)+] n=1 Tax=Canibacter oris TaxID=1365628 RepID=A0A840DLR0_9MICO|nr:NAD(P)H-dependent glycerol-3-phosphate dehydrogenase [Canibacter oris]MBB4071008.1 glycerol-3-phosphate dehydrogenase (NAD(P)+) [Canibacter oris]RRD36477.1 NAD(P)-dependent glycerol-3-phosphate dehydrogenase [Leucobacter sp. OH2974_COT-288]
MVRKTAPAKPKAVVIGSGSWGTTFAKVLADAGCETVIWARRQEVADEINSEHRNSKYLPEIQLPPDLTATTDLTAAVGTAEYVFLAVPSQQLRGVLEQLVADLHPEAIIISLIKGVERNTNLRMSQVITETLEWSIEQVAVISGPNIALEIAKQQPTGAVVSCVDLVVAQKVAKLTSTPYFKTYITTDLTGTELGGVLKNLIALAIGIVDGVGYGENTKAAIITRGIAEMNEFAVASGAHPTTMMGLAGLGDLITTCQSPLSRNSTAGRLLGSGLTREQIAERMNQVVEGITAVTPVLELAQKRAIKMPIVEQVQMVLDGRMPPHQLGPHLTTEDDVPEHESSAAEKHHKLSLWQKIQRWFGALRH